jgi:hypothetical protein
MVHVHKGKIKMDLDLKDQTGHVHKGKIQMGLVQMDQTRMDRVLKDRIKMDRVLRGQIMVRALRGIDHKGQIQTGLVQIMMLDQKMETTHKKKDLETSRSFFLSNCHLL